MDDIRALELYSGIGGMHFALKDCIPDATVVAAVDINSVANEVYKHNFPEVDVLGKGIEGLSVKKLNDLDFNMVLMSPPCQPFTRIGLQKDINDPRTKSFLHFLSLLPKLKKKPNCILLENVKGFESSEAHLALCRTLDKCGYHRIEFLLTPKQFGIPNARLRYYMLAKTEEFHPCIQKNVGKIWESLPFVHSDVGSFHTTFKAYNKQRCTVTDADTHVSLTNGPAAKKAKVHEVTIQRNQCENTSLNIEESENGILPLSNFLDDNVAEDYGVPENIVRRYIGVLDIVGPDSASSICFTKSYTQYAEGTGSVLDLKNNEIITVKSQERKPEHYKLRYFTPREVANLLMFPDLFTFPSSVTKKQRYRLLGNSLNVQVVSFLLQLLTAKSDKKGFSDQDG